MAGIEQAFFARLAADATIVALIGDGASPESICLYPARTPQEPAFPCVIYRRISAVREQDFDGPAGFCRARFQFDILSEDYATGRAVADALRLSLDGFTGMMGTVPVYGIELENEQEQAEDKPDLYRTIMDFVITYKEET